MIKFAISALVLIAAIAATDAQAQDTHVLSPRYPDHFKVEITHTSSSDQTSNAGQVTTHTRLVFDEDVRKTDTGYKATFTGVSADADGQGPDGKPSPQAGMQKRILGVITAIGPAEVSLDKDMTPLSIDNIEILKPRIKQGLTNSGNAKDDAMGVQLYDAFVSGLTPETAAGFLKQARQAGAETLYNKPLPLHTPVPLSGAPLSFMGATMHLTGTVTLDDWKEGQSATVTTVLAPTDSDLHSFMTAFIHNMMAKMMTRDEAEAKDLIDHMVDHMKIAMTVTCHSTTDLTNFIIYNSQCDTTSAFTMDLAKAMPPEMLKQAPQLANMPPMSMRQVEHSVNETHLIP